MTIKELKKVLKGLPDNTDVCMYFPQSQYNEHINKISIEHNNADYSVYVVLRSNFVNCK